MSDQPLNEALAAALLERVTQAGKLEDPRAASFIRCAAQGEYRRVNPILPEYIGMTADEFTALRLLIYPER